MSSALWWSHELLERFEASRGYNPRKYLPLMFHQSNTLRDEYRPYNNTYIVDDDVEVSGQNKYLQDYRLTLSEGYREYLGTIEEWAQSLSMEFSAQPAYNLPIDMVSPKATFDCHAQAEVIDFLTIDVRLEAFPLLVAPKPSRSPFPTSISTPNSLEQPTSVAGTSSPPRLGPQWPGRTASLRESCSHYSRSLSPPVSTPWSYTACRTAGSSYRLGLDTPLRALRSAILGGGGGRTGSIWMMLWIILRETSWYSRPGGREGMWRFIVTMNLGR